MSVRKLARNYNGLQAPALEDYQREAMKNDMWVQGVSVALLSGFSVWNQASYLAQTWKPDPIFGLPVSVDILIRALGPAVFFFLTSFAAPAAKTIGEKLGDESHKTLGSFLRVLTRQRKRAIKKIDADLTDMSDAINVVAGAANERRAGGVLASVQSAIARLAQGQPVSAPPPQSRSASSIRSTRSALEECRLVWHEGMTPKELAAKVGCSEKTARRHIKTLQDAFVVTPG